MHDASTSSSAPFAQGRPPQSSELPYASSARAGRVGAASRTYTALVAVANIESGDLAKVPPRYIDVPASGDRLVLERSGSGRWGYDVRSHTGLLAFTRNTSSAGEHVLVRADVHYVGGAAVSWSGIPDENSFSAIGNADSDLLAISVTNGEKLTLSAIRSEQEPHGPARPNSLSVMMSRLEGPSATARAGWLSGVAEAGVGAIDASGRAVLASSGGRFIVLSAHGDSQGIGIFEVDAQVAPNATDLSIVPPYAMVLYGGGDAGEMAARRGAFARSSRLEAHRSDGSLAWSVTASFLARQPPIEGHGRVYLVGGGIAAFDLDGKLLWSAPSNVPLRAVAFVDGALAVVRGSEVRIVGHDGGIKQSFRAAEELTTYPAIGPDGAVWVASAKTLYVAR